MNFFAKNSIVDNLTRLRNAKEELNLKHCPIRKDEMKEILRKEAMNRMKLKWNEDDYMTAKAFKLDRFTGDYFLSLNRSDFALLFYFVTGHNYLFGHYHMTRDNMAACRFCGNSRQKETSIHIIEDCENFDNARYEVFEFRQFKLSNMRNVKLSDVLEFLKKAEISDYIVKKPEL